jgi:hypothetical protein
MTLTAEYKKVNSGEDGITPWMRGGGAAHEPDLTLQVLKRREEPCTGHEDGTTAAPMT